MKFSTVLSSLLLTSSSCLIGTVSAMATKRVATPPPKKVATPVKKIVAPVPVKKVVTPVAKKVASVKVSTGDYSIDSIPGALAPTGIWDPWGLAAKADANLLKRYREAELAHSRVAMLAVVGFLVGEWVEGSSFLFDASISGPAITHFFQVPKGFWILLTASIGVLELNRAEIGWVPPSDVPLGKPGLLRPNYIPGTLGFDPLKLKPSDPAEYLKLQNNELQNGRLAMLAAAGFLAQEATDGKGILEHLFA